MRLAAGSGIAFVALVTACGSLLAASGADDVPPANGGGADAATDAGPSSAEGGSADAAPPVARICPTFDCPTEDIDAGEQCKDDLCEDDELDFDVAGVVTTAEGRCVASGPEGEEAYTFNHFSDPARTRESVSVALSFDVTALATTDRTIAGVGIRTDPDGQRFEAVVTNGQIRLCERSMGAETCTAGVPFPGAARVHLYGVLSSDNPARGSFALSLDGCSGTQVLPVARPFAEGPVAGAVGCRLHGTSACAMTYDNVVLFVRPE